LNDFAESLRTSKDYKVVKAALDAWFHEAQAAVWNSLAEVKESYGNASVVGKDRVVFNIKGNDYRLVTAIDYQRKLVFIKWLGTHKEYDRIDVRTVQYAHKADQK
jgi:mRNA interferase HigB